MQDKKSVFTPSTKSIHEQIDSVLSRSPIELQQVKDNLEFIKQIKEDPVDPDESTVEVFGFETVDVSAILKNNIWNRSIFTVDKLCKLFLKMDIEQKKKYLKKRRGMDFNYAWLLLLLIGIPIILIIIVFLLPVLPI